MPLTPAFAAVPPVSAPALRPHHGATAISLRRRQMRMVSSNGAPVSSNLARQPDDNVFSIKKTVMPADSDYSMSLWHGSYVRWLEEARVRYLKHMRLPYEELVVEHNTELIVRDLQLRYLAPAKLGDELLVTIRVAASDSKVRIPIESQFLRVADGKMCATSTVTIVPVDAKTGRPRRVWPQPLTDSLRGAMEAAQAAAESA